VTYINHIEYGGLDEIGSALARILTCWTNRTSDGWLPAPDHVILNLAVPIPHEAGRLHVERRPIVRREDKQQMLRLELTARSAITKRELGEAMDWMDLGHQRSGQSLQGPSRRPPERGCQGNKDHYIDNHWHLYHLAGRASHWAQRRSPRPGVRVCRFVIGFVRKWYGTR